MKKNSRIYEFLDASGLLEHYTDESVKQAKRRYWNEYKKKWNKEKQKKSKTYEIVFGLNEANIIIKEAKNRHISPSRYIKRLALVGNRNIVDPIAIGEIRELAILHHNWLLTLTEEAQLPEKIGGELLSQASQLEKRILDFLSSFK